MAGKAGGTKAHDASPGDNVLTLLPTGDHTRKLKPQAGTGKTLLDGFVRSRKSSYMTSRKFKPVARVPLNLMFPAACLAAAIAVAQFSGTWKSSGSAHRS
jgi:hypothetical protein